MRLSRLDLLRYGHLAGVALDFPSAAGLCVVEGANEAGKSTALAAIADALFGFRDERRKDRRRPDFLYPSTQLGVGVSLVARDGTEASFIRRKRRADALSDPAGEALPEAAIRRFLGGVGREAFERRFGLNGERLRAGADDLLASGGDVGESLLAAGTGLFGLRAAIAALDEEAKGLVGDGRGRRKLSAAVDEWRAASKRTDECAVRPKEWQDAEAGHAALDAALSGMQEQASALGAEANRLQRTRRVAPILAALDHARVALAAVADAPLLPPDAEAQRQQAVQARDDAARRAASAAAEAGRLTAAASALTRDPAVLAVAEAIDRLAALRPVAVHADADLPGVRAELAALREAAAAAIADLGLDATPEAAFAAIPAAEARDAVQALLDRHAALEAGCAAAARERREVAARLDAAAAALAGSPEPPDPALLRATVDSVRGEGRLDSDLAKAERTLAAAMARTEAALASLPLWERGLDALAAAPVPLAAEIDAAAAGLDAAGRTLADAAAALAAIEAEIAETEDVLARIAAGEEVPTPAAIAARRAERDHAWRALRRRLAGEADPASAGPGPADPAAFEALVAEADRLADRRADQAQRVHEYVAAAARRDRLRARHPEAAARHLAAIEAHAAAQAAWAARWAPSGVVPLTPVAMAEWLRRRTEVLALADQAEAAAAGRDDLAARRATARAALLRVFPDADEGDMLAPLFTRAEIACAAAEAATASWRERAAALARETEALPGRDRAARDAEAELSAWHAGWIAALAPLALPQDADRAAARVALAAWARLDAAAPKFRSDANRIHSMEETVGRFRTELAAVLAAIGGGEGVGADDGDLAVRRLETRLEAAKQAERDAARLKGEIARHLAEQQDAAQAGAAADAILASLRAAAGVTDDEALRHAIASAAERDGQRRTISGHEAALAAQGDGSDEAALRAEAADIDPDRAAARLAGIEAEQHAIGERREAASAERARLAAVLDGMRRGEAAAAAAQDAQHALAEAKEAAERYARVHVARELLRAGVERYRRSQQAPLLSAAGRHFAALTAGRYVRLDVDQDMAGHFTLAAIRDDASACPVEALSEGTRDQLYLALRVAAVEAHAREAEPLPFVADDLLVHFDDTRAAAAIDLLARLGRTAQVILFTHHAHVADLARARHTPEIAVLRLPTATAAAHPPLLVAAC